MTSGPSTVTFESPDTTVWRFRGNVSEETMRALTFREKQLTEGQPYLLKLVDMTWAGAISSGARKAGAEKVHEIPVLAVAIFGANFAIRVLANLVIRAGSLMRKIDTVPTQFFETEMEARAWLANKRTELKVNASNTPPGP
jgi:hypothetical protein